MIDSKTRAFLRGKANQISPSYVFGKGGINENIINDISDALEAHELVKVSVLKNSEYTAKEIANEIAPQINADVVSVVGGKFVLYRMSSKDGVKHVLEEYGKR